MIKRLSLVLVCLIAVAGILPVSAQDGGLTGDQQALLDRLAATVDRIEGYSSYKLNTVEVRTDELELTASGTTLIGLVEATLTSERFDTWGDNPMAHSFVSAEVTQKGLRETAATNYSIDAEFRYVDGAVYVLAERETAADAALDPMPEGWVQVEDEETWPALEHIRMDIFLDRAAGETLSDELKGLRDTITRAVDVSSEPGTLDDGTPVDVISTVVDADGIIAFLLEEDEDEEISAEERAMNIAMAKGVTANSRWETTFWLLEDGTLARYTSTLSIVWENFDMTTLGDSYPAGMIMNRTMTQSYDLVLSRINEPFPPVEVPAIQ
ncbi:MAG: hypothetical protein JW966_13060 [Anaerolineae bacterium]|nr:hypothetical protein [Anaerolineae bacterium]